MIYQAGDDIEQQKEQLTHKCKIIITKTKLTATRKKFAICKILQKGNWAGVLDYDKVTLLPPNNKRKSVKVLDVQSVEHKGKKRKLVLVEDGTVFNIKRSRLEDSVQAGHFI